MRWKPAWPKFTKVGSESISGVVEQPKCFENFLNVFYTWPPAEIHQSGRWGSLLGKLKTVCDITLTIISRSMVCQSE